MMSIYVEDPKGHIRKIHYIPNLDGRGSHAYVRTSLFRKEHQWASGPNVIDNLILRLERRGWKDRRK